MTDDATDNSPPPNRTGFASAISNDMYARAAGTAGALSGAAQAGADLAKAGIKLPDSTTSAQLASLSMAAEQKRSECESVLPSNYHAQLPIPPAVIPRDLGWDVAKHTRQLAEQAAADSAAMAELREEDERKEAERDAREERAPKVAEDSLAEARRSRIITAWSVGIAIVAVITVLVAG